MYVYIYIYIYTYMYTYTYTYTYIDTCVRVRGHCVVWGPYIFHPPLLTCGGGVVLWWCNVVVCYTQGPVKRRAPLCAGPAWCWGAAFISSPF